MVTTDSYFSTSDVTCIYSGLHVQRQFVRRRRGISGIFAKYATEWGQISILPNEGQKDRQRCSTERVRVALLPHERQRARRRWRDIRIPTSRVAADVRTRPWIV